MSGTTLTCPKCEGAMRTYERGGVTVDQCGECRGIFLDRGELDRLIDAERGWHSDDPAPREAPYQPSAPYRQERSGYREHDDHDGYSNDGYSNDGHARKRRKKSFLDELFD
jgi:Zn-finger nucleic acid-binding protein